MMTLFL